MSLLAFGGFARPRMISRDWKVFFHVLVEMSCLKAGPLVRDLSERCPRILGTWMPLMINFL